MKDTFENLPRPEAEAVGQEPHAAGDFTIYYNKTTYIPKSSTTVKAEPFTVIRPGNNDPIFVRAETIPGDSWNAAITNMDTETEIGSKTHIPVGKFVIFHNIVPGANYGIRASSNDVAGYAHMLVFQAPVESAAEA